jgi:osmoprotectant transport system substrate-binding protein
LSDLAKSYNDGQHLVMALDAEFPRRPDGLPALEKAYGFSMTRDERRSMNSGLTYQALRDGLVDLALVFATDGRVKAFNFRLLTDDKGAFPSYDLVPVVRTSILKANPGIEKPLNDLSAKLNNDVMQTLNAKVDVSRKSIKDVARNFLADNGLI